MASDLVDVYSAGEVGPEYGTKSEFVRNNVLNPSVTKTYGSDMAMFALFAALGVFGTVRRLMSGSN